MEDLELLCIDDILIIHKEAIEMFGGSFAFQEELFQEVAASVNMMGKALKENIKKEYDDVYLIGMAGCTLCDVCSYPTEKCRHPDEVVTSISGNCINVYRLWESTGFTRPSIDLTDLYVIILYKDKTQSHQDQ